MTSLSKIIKYLQNKIKANILSKIILTYDYYKENKSNLSETFCNEVYSVVREIPAGSVTTYGDIAALLGMPQYSRMVGRALRQVPAGLNLPCHRVVNAIGRLVPGWDEQRRLLDAEGVSFRKNGCVDLRLHRWRDDSVLAD